MRGEGEDAAYEDCLKAAQLHREAVARHHAALVAARGNRDLDLACRQFTLESLAAVADARAAVALFREAVARLAAIRGMGKPPASRSAEPHAAPEDGRGSG